MLFFPIFWTAYIPFFIAVVLLLGEWLMRSLRRMRGHAWAPVGALRHVASRRH